MIQGWHLQDFVTQLTFDQEDRHMSDIDRVWELMETVRFCMFATWTGSRLRSRPMSASLSRDENVIRFLTDVRQHKTRRFESFRKFAWHSQIRVIKNMFQFPGMPRSQMTERWSKVVVSLFSHLEVLTLQLPSAGFLVDGPNKRSSQAGARGSRSGFRFNPLDPHAPPFCQSHREILCDCSRWKSLASVTTIPS